MGAVGDDVPGSGGAFEAGSASAAGDNWTAVASGTGAKGGDDEPLAIVSTSGPFINEFHYNDAGTDEREFVEIAAPAGFNLTNYRLFFYDSSGTCYRVETLSGTADNPTNGFGFLTVIFPTPSELIVNGLRSIALVDPAGDLLEFLSYDGTITGSNGPEMGRTSTNIGVSETDTSSEGGSLARRGTGDGRSDFTFQSGPATVGRVNDGQTFASSPPAPTPPSPPPTAAAAAAQRGDVQHR